MKSLQALNPQERANIQYVLTDVDDTITTNGKLRVEALQALWQWKEVGYRVICITGGSAGWSDAYLRQWPIEAVVSESGAVCLYKEGDSYRTYINPSLCQKGYKERMHQLIETVLAQVPCSKVSSDQFARRFDIAFDYHSEPPYLNSEEVAHIVSICHAAGAHTAVSSIHVNAWFGEYDKYQGCKDFFHDVLQVSEEDLLSQSIYIGDAPNDEVMFSHFPLSFAVGNFKQKAHLVHHLPQFISDKEGGLGFAEIADVFCSVH